MAIFIDGEHNCACARPVCDWSCITYAKLMSDNIPNTDVGYVPPTKKTNADRIRAMTDDELAKLFSRHIDCEVCPIREENRIGFCRAKDCKEAIMEWLKEEVEA